MSEKPWDLMIVGELNADILLTGDVTPEFGQVEKIIDDVSICAGSSSGIFAAQAAKLGLRVLLASRVGDDLLGHYMLHELEQAGVDTRHVSVDPAIKTGATVILSRGQDRAMLTFLGSIAAVGPAATPAGDDAPGPRGRRHRVAGHELGSRRRVGAAGLLRAPGRVPAEPGGTDGHQRTADLLGGR